MFQSHLGSILPTVVRQLLAPHTAFQSHLGSILPRGWAGHGSAGQAVSIPPWFDFAPLPPTQQPPCKSRFNPTLVRFCPAVRITVAQVGEKFQSHLGSILPETADMQRYVDAVFQSHLGSILPRN